MNVLVIPLLTLAGVAIAQPPAQPDPKPAEKAPAPATPPTAVPSLDEALGLSKPADKPKPPADSKQPLPGELDKALKGDQPGNELEKAVALMGESASRLEKSKDTSIQVQRMQEETVRLLDALIKKGGQKKPNPNSQPKPQSQDQQQEQQPNQSPQSQQQQQPQANKDPSDDPNRGGSANTKLRPAIEAARAAWGNLPQRVRQLLMQGSGDQFSKEYQRLTEEYYKRLGEQGN